MEIVYASMLELVVKRDLKSLAVWRAGSTPVGGTEFTKTTFNK